MKQSVRFQWRMHPQNFLLNIKLKMAAYRPLFTFTCLIFGKPGEDAPCKKNFRHYPTDCLKGLAQAKIIKKSVILFRVLNMTI